MNMDQYMKHVRFVFDNVDSFIAVTEPNNAEFELACDALYAAWRKLRNYERNRSTVAELKKRFRESGRCEERRRVRFRRPVVSELVVIDNDDNTYDSDNDASQAK